MSVSMNPGATALQVTPREASSRAVDMVNPIRPALRRRVRRLAAVALLAHHRGDVDDPAGVLGA